MSTVSIIPILTGTSKLQRGESDNLLREETDLSCVIRTPLTGITLAFAISRKKSSSALPYSNHQGSLTTNKESRTFPRIAAGFHQHYGLDRDAFSLLHKVLGKELFQELSSDPGVRDLRRIPEVNMRIDNRIVRHIVHFFSDIDFVNSRAL